ncbi:TetR/AcrR family transcriptional regulator [Amycolatopsis sp. SID8362]|uniref:TetR/AcrR family transcriptional regulator n=1 Tax=Amycolatopsis sp. SID8362 TaxID=2690346 RepID=UPI00137125C5|nr:TetR/AcrR family transcriptional regulator [Amycolatopsis sp. SID8362]NBH04926.1 TetR family transcriptional regulator [Amycolatopsis sp. SID8362]NED41627.1 TetR family transcriptional regulator [Amycolatopsis sp. SID8362]
MSTVKSRREQYSEATRAALLSAATRRFAEHGFGGTALEDIAADIQATRGAIYHHFANKTALFEAVFEQLETGAMELSAAAAAQADDPWTAAFAALDAFLDRCCDPVYGRLVWQEAPIALGWPRWQAAEEQFAYGLVEQLIKALVDDGDLDGQPLETTTRLVFGMLGTAGMALAEASDVDKARLKAEYTAVIGRMASGLRRSG